MEPEEEFLEIVDEGRAPLARKEQFESSFWATCQWMRKHHVAAFFLGLFSFGLTYAMAGIAGAESGSSHAPLIAYWSSRRLKWLAFFALIGQTYFIISASARALSDIWIFIATLPFALLLLLGIAEILYEIFRNTDGFFLTTGLWRTDEETVGGPRGPARLAYWVVNRVPQDFRLAAGFLWAWILGLVFVMTFVAGLALAFMFAFFFVAFVIVAFIISFFDNDPVRRRPEPVQVFPPIPIDGMGIPSQSGGVSQHRVKGRIIKGRRKVGHLQGAKIYYYRAPSGESVPIFEIDGLDIRDLRDGSIYGQFNETGVYDLEGRLIYPLVEVSG